jgi:hypothetical protein
LHSLCGRAVPYGHVSCGSYFIKYHIELSLKNKNIKLLLSLVIKALSQEEVIPMAYTVIEPIAL